MKYHHDFPNRFASFADALTFCRGFFDWYNHDHRHSGIEMLSPAVVDTGEHHDVLARRQARLDVAYAEHPERFVHGPPTVKDLPTAVYLYKPEPKPQPEAHYLEFTMSQIR